MGWVTEGVAGSRQLVRQEVKQQLGLLDRVCGGYGSRKESKEGPCSCVNNRTMTTEKTLYRW